MGAWIIFSSLADSFSAKRSVDWSSMFCGGKKAIRPVSTMHTLETKGDTRQYKGFTGHVAIQTSFMDGRVPLLKALSNIYGRPKTKVRITGVRSSFACILCMICRHLCCFGFVFFSLNKLTFRGLGSVALAKQRCIMESFFSALKDRQTFSVQSVCRSIKRVT